MNRRKWLSTVALAVVLPGCTDNGSTPRSEDAPTFSARTTADPTDRKTSTQSCEWPDMCAGTKLVEVTVSNAFSGDVVLDAGCRDGTHTVQPGESYSIKRRSDAGSCDLQLTVNDEEVFNTTVSGSEMYELTIEPDGELETSFRVL